MSTVAPTTKLLRFMSPSSLLFALFLFPLPWIEIACDIPANSVRRTPAQTVVLLEQSGMQSVLGTVSEGEAFQAQRKTDVEKKPEQVPSALLIIAYPFVVFLAVIIGFALPLSRRRIAILASCCATALALLAVQTAAGFPIAAKVKQDFAKKEAEKELPVAFTGSDFRPPYARYAPAFYLSWAVLIVSLSFVLLERLLSAPLPADQVRNSSSTDETS